MNATLPYTKTEINRNFRIKVNGKENGKKINSLFGVSGLINLIGIEFFVKFVTKAFNSLTDKITFKLRRGLKITFYVK